MPNRLTAHARRLLRWTLWTVGSLVLLVVLLSLYITFIGITIDASALRGRLADTFAQNIGRTVRFDGPVRLEVSAHPKLLVRGLHIANAPGFEGGDFASLGEARLALDLWPLLFRKRLQVEELSGSDVRMLLQLRADGGNNWTFKRPQSAAPQPPPSPAKGAPAMTAEEAVTLLDIQRVSLQALNVQYIGPDGKPHYFDLHTLQAQSPAGQPFTMTLNGAVEKSFPYKLEFSGGRLADLSFDKPWPVSLTLTFLSSTLTVNGNVSGNSGEVIFGLGTGSLTEFERLFQTKLPDVGASAMAGTIRYSPRKASLIQLTGVMGRTTLTGKLDFDYTGQRPKITGELLLPSLDLRPFLGEQPRDDATPPRNLGDLYRDLSNATFSLKQFATADMDVILGVQRWLSLPGDVRDAFLHIKLQEGHLEVPVGAVISGVELSGAASADSTANPPNFRLALGTRDSDLGGLAQLLLGVQGMKGHLGRFDLRLAATGDQVSELVRSLDVRLDIDHGRFSYGNLEGGRPVEFGLEKLSVSLPPTKPLSGSMRGTLLGHPFLAQLRAGALEPIMLEGRSPLDFDLRSGSVRARLQGSLQPPARDRGPDIAFDISAPRAGELANWFGFKPGADAPAALSGKASMRTGEWALNDVVFKLGRTVFSASLARTGIGSQPLVKIRLAAQQIDLQELESLMPAPKERKKNSERPMVDIPILPQGIDLTDADIEVRVKKFAGSPLEVRDVSFDGRIRNGYMNPSPFAATVADTAFTGAVLMDLRGMEPSAGLWLFAGNIDAGKLLRKFGIAANIDATFSEFGINLVARSSRLGDMLARSELLGQIGGGRITLRDPNTKAEARIAVEKGELRADPGMPLRLSIKGALDDIPVSVSLETARAYELVDPNLPMPFIFEAEAAQTRVKLAGAIARPLGSEIELGLEMNGPRFDSLNKLVRASLPPWGPWSASGVFRMSSRGYEVPNLKLQVGESVLNGDGRLDTTGTRPRLDVSLTAPNVQLDDFKLGDWSPVEKKPDEKEKKLTAEEMRAKAAEGADRAQKLLSREVLLRQDAYLNVKVDQVLSGQDKLGSGQLQAKLENGRAELGPVLVNVPGGSAKLLLGYEPTDADVKVDLAIDVEKFDYGILARRSKPGTDLQGTFSLKMDVDSRAQYLSDILRHGNGRIEFAVWPKNMQSGIFDLWAVNVLVALVPAVDPGKASKVNCAIGRFQLSDGKLVDRVILMDTSRMRVTGKGSADFARESLDLRMRPQAKTAQFLSLATPISVSGTFSNFKIGVSPGDVVETVGRLATSILWVPLQKIAGKKIPADGSDVCFGRLDDAVK
ncbi:MAG TPA: AsmA family protein [Burkholderiales bacterium]